MKLGVIISAYVISIATVVPLFILPICSSVSAYEMHDPIYIEHQETTEDNPLVIEGYEITNPGGPGIQVPRVNHAIVRNNHIHDCGIEVSNVVDSAIKGRRLLDEMGSPHLKVVMDPANIFHAGELPRMHEIIDEAFSLLGGDIAIAHAKDLDRDGEAGHIAVGKGRLDYDQYLPLLSGTEPDMPIILHGLAEAQVSECVAFLRGKLETTNP